MRRYCDIVMKGGITSGVVYPLAVVKLSERYTFKNVGGTSAGAIAAAAVAAAEHGRSKGSEAGFEKLRELPTWLGQHMTQLFQPSPSTRPLFSMLVAASRGKSRLDKLARALAAALAGFGGLVAAGALPGVAIAVASLADASGLALWLGLAFGLLLAVLGAAFGLAAGIARRVVVALPANDFGLVRGYVEEPQGEVAALTSWLADLLDRLAAKQGSDALTFGDLWGPGLDGERNVNLEMITTCLTQQRPYKLPFEVNDFWFWPKQMRKLFPARIVEQMVRDARPDPRAARFAPLVPLPEAAKLPVVVATRMSLSFPLLISAVPLYAIDYSRTIAGEDRHPEPCWFSDGGITSNFPVHFFDSPIPRWPTFGIDLRKLPDDWTPSDVECENAWMAADNDPIQDQWWTSWDKRAPTGRLVGFLTSIFQTMQNWNDTMQSRAQGYRDRIVHIDHTKTEGGLNLAMTAGEICRLSKRGECAGDLLRRRFAVPPETSSPLTWDNQRWIRYRSFMVLLEDTLARLGKGCTEQPPGDRTIEELSRRGPTEPPELHWLSDDQRDWAIDATRDLLALSDQWDKSGQSFKPRAPEPAPELRVMPRV
jgi:predicted acylesterase/phospholipase RssA